MLGEFEGALVVVSHDREFLDGLCTVILEVDHGTVLRFEGNYSAWRAARLAAQESARNATRAAADAAKAAQRVAERAVAQGTSRAGASRPGASRPDKQAAANPAAPSGAPKKASAAGKIRNPWAFEKLEQRIIALEAELKSLQEALVTEEVWRDAQKLKETQMRAAEVERDLAVANHEWENWG
jgi:ATPase subunit of ABC transporter with duplicated ATPase domains